MTRLRRKSKRLDGVLHALGTDDNLLLGGLLVRDGMRRRSLLGSVSSSTTLRLIFLPMDRRNGSDSGAVPTLQSLTNLSSLWGSSSTASLEP